MAGCLSIVVIGLQWVSTFNSIETVIIYRYYWLTTDLRYVRVTRHELFIVLLIEKKKIG